jgi:pyrroline-5-carboxylate reductase
MPERTIGIVGGGRIARILLGGWKRAGKLPASIVVSDADGAVLERLKAQFPSIAVHQDGNRRSAAQDLVLFALHPPAFSAGLAEIKGSLRAEAVLISLAPKWTMSKISQALGGFDRLVRAIPNAPSIVNQGYNPISFSGGLSVAERREVLALLEPWGQSPEVAEETLEAYAIVSAMGPTYLWYQLYQLAELGRSFGLSPEATDAAVAAMVSGTLRTMADSGMTQEAVMDLIPVKPLSAIEPTVKEAYANTLGGLFRKLKE